MGGVSTLADIYVEEGFHERLLNLLQLTSGDIRFIESYSTHLTKEYPEEILELYEKGVRKAAVETGRKEYKRVVYYLQSMRNIKGGDEVAAGLVRKLLQEYSNRPAMRDEFRKSFPGWMLREE